MARRPSAILTCLVLIGLATASSGQQLSVPNVVYLKSEEETIPRYAVEMIVFEYVDSAANTTEIFEQQIPEHDVEVVVDEALPDSTPPVFTDRPITLPVFADRLITPAAEELPLVIVFLTEDGELLDAEIEEPFVLMPGETLEEIPTFENTGREIVNPADYQLFAAWEKLVALDAYRPLMLTAWIQPTLEKEETDPLELRRIGDPPLRLEGTISLYQSRFLHLVVDLSLEHLGPAISERETEPEHYFGDNGTGMPLEVEPAFARPSVIYRIEEDRIVRNNEIRYFDHPKFGAITRISRVEEEEHTEVNTDGEAFGANLIQ